MKRDEKETTETQHRRITLTVKKVFLLNDGYILKKVRKFGFPWPPQDNATAGGQLTHNLKETFANAALFEDELQDNSIMCVL